MQSEFVAKNWRGDEIKLVMVDCIYSIAVRNPFSTVRIQVSVDVLDTEKNLITIADEKAGKVITISASTWFSMRPEFVRRIGS